MSPAYQRHAVRLRRSVAVGLWAGLLVAFVTGQIRFLPDTLALRLFGYPLAIGQFYVVFLLLTAGFGLLVYSTYRYGRVFCSWVCGYHQLLELLLGRRLRGLRWVGAVALTFCLSWSIGHFLDDLPFLSFPSPAATVLALCVFAALLIALFGYRERFCRWACPYGIIQVLLRGKSPLRVEFQPAGCTNCRRCDRTCPMTLSVRAECSSLHCTNCTRCIAACTKELGPGRETLAMTARPVDPDPEDAHAGILDD